MQISGTFGIQLISRKARAYTLGYIHAQKYSFYFLTYEWLLLCITASSVRDIVDHRERALLHTKTEGTLPVLEELFSKNRLD